MTIREHLTEAARFDPSAAAELRGPSLPSVALHAWEVFNALHARRPLSAQGVTPLSYEALDAYTRLTDTPLTPLDVHLVTVIDDCYVATTAQAMAPDDTPDETPDLPTEDPA